MPHKIVTHWPDATRKCRRPEPRRTDARSNLQPLSKTHRSSKTGRERGGGSKSPEQSGRRP